MQGPAAHGVRRSSERVLGKITVVGRSHAAARQRRRRGIHQTAAPKPPKTPTRGPNYGLPGRAEIQLRGDLSTGCTFARPKGLKCFVFFQGPQTNKTQLNCPPFAAPSCVFLREPGASAYFKRPQLTGSNSAAAAALPHPLTLEPTTLLPHSHPHRSTGCKHRLSAGTSTP